MSPLSHPQKRTPVPVPSASHWRSGLVASAASLLLVACGGSDGPAPGPDAGGLSIVSSSPANGATDVDRGVRPELTMSAPVQADTVQFLLEGATVAATVSANGRYLRISPAARLVPVARYTVRVGQGPSISFTTADGAWGAPQSLEDRVDSAYEPRVAADASGNAIAVWRQADSIGSIWASRYQPGTGWSTPQTIEADSGVAYDPEIAMDAAGNAIVTWRQWNSSVYELRTNRYVVGSGWGTAQLLQNASVNAHRIAMNSGGEAVAVWIQNDGAESNVYANRFTPAGGWQGAQRLESEPNASADPVVALEPSGHAIVAWRQHQAGGSGVHDVFAVDSGRTGGWSAPVAVEAATQSIDQPISIAASADGSFFLVWEQGLREVWANGFRPGTGWKGVVRINGDSDNNASDPRVAMDANGGAVVAWIQDDAYSDVWTRRYTPGGGWQAPERVEDLDRDASQVHVAVDARGNALVVWRQYQGGANEAVFAARQVAGKAWTGIGQLSEAISATSSAPFVAIDGTGSAVAVWEQTIGQEYNVKAVRFD
ncbi:Ig-like domain-containing protein [Ramlibacter pallidus]|uniref:Ig-like domain-containing protein n=1 Tax=Ramlibacter pallidus TaxID=2780087 RepID=A0ABR9RZ89_9BURK|nr:Ig-like domain-containing protein [Ramlibacter pallidus]MBE7366543.1 Ig-like domain-containing protein [Ramlibacter pallidus]